MKKKNISVTSSSFIIPEHYSWNEQNQDYYKLDFKFVNNLSEGFHKTKKSDILFCKIFINDLIDESKNYKKSEIYKINRLVANLIKNRLNFSTESTIIFFSIKRNKNIFSDLKKRGNLETLFNLIDKTLLDLSQKYKELIVLNINNFLDDRKLNFFDERNWYLVNCRLSSDGHELISQYLYKILDKLKTTAKKVLILDCDNTLWGGVIGEDGIDNIQIGQDGKGKAFLDFQKKIKLLSQTGVLLCISSKNNQDDVMEVFNNHQNMQIKKRDIVSFKVNWKEKYLNIKEISEELNLSLDSMVFWDDNPLERNKIKKFLPTVTVIDPFDDISLWPKQIQEIEYFSKLNSSKEDKNKLEQYKIRSKFLDQKKTSTNEIEYLKSINIKPKILELNKDNISRATQMTQKTNQFNLRTKRYSLSDLTNFKKNKLYEIRLVSLKDIYGDHGIVGMFILKKLNKNEVFLDTFLISCRVFGRYLETWMMYQIKKIAKNLNYKMIIGEHIKTKKNLNICKTFFEDHNFKFKNKKFYLANPNDISSSNIRVYERK